MHSEVGMGDPEYIEQETAADDVEIKVCNLDLPVNTSRCTSSRFAFLLLPWQHSPKKHHYLAGIPGGDDSLRLKPRASGMTPVYRPTPIVRFMPMSETSSKQLMHRMARLTKTVVFLPTVLCRGT